MVKPMIHSEKHMVARSLLTIQEQTLTRLSIAQAVAVPTNQTHVREGATVKAVWVEIWHLGESSQPCVQISTFEKTTGESPQMTFTQSQALNDYANKKNILKMSQGQVGDSNTNPVPVFREWIPIPKGKQRMGLGDRIDLNVSCVGVADNGLQVCGMFIYKEYF